MAVTPDQPGPYAPASAILELVQRHRNKGLPPVVDGDVLERAGVSNSLIARTLQALKTLDLLTEDGKPTEVLEGIRLAPESEYKARLTQWLNAAYADALTFVDPATDSEDAFRDAFRKYTPIGQQDRMVTLFTGLFTAAGVIEPKAKNPPKKMIFVPSTKRRLLPPTTAQKPNSGGQTGGQQQVVGLPPAISGLLASLPKDGDGWTQERRNKFITTFGAVVDFCFPIVTEAVGAAAATSTATATSQ